MVENNPIKKKDVLLQITPVPVQVGDDTAQGLSCQGSFVDVQPCVRAIHASMPALQSSTQSVISAIDQ